MFSEALTDDSDSTYRSENLVRGGPDLRRWLIGDSEFRTFFAAMVIITGVFDLIAVAILAGISSGEALSSFMVFLVGWVALLVIIPIAGLILLVPSALTFMERETTGTRAWSPSSNPTWSYLDNSFDERGICAFGIWLWPGLGQHRYCGGSSLAVRHDLGTTNSTLGPRQPTVCQGLITSIAGSNQIAAGPGRRVRHCGNAAVI